MGGASGAFGLPQAAAKRIFAGRSPHPLPSGVLKHGTVEQEDTPVAAVPALCADFGGGVRGRAPVDGISAVLGRVWGGGCPDHPNSERERLREAPFRALWGRSILVLG